MDTRVSALRRVDLIHPTARPLFISVMSIEGIERRAAP